MSHPVEMCLFFPSFQLSFRTSTESLLRLKGQVRRLLQLPDEGGDDVGSDGTGSQLAAQEMGRALDVYLRRVSQDFSLAKNVEVMRTG